MLSRNMMVGQKNVKLDEALAKLIGPLDFSTESAETLREILRRAKIGGYVKVAEIVSSSTSASWEKLSELVQMWSKPSESERAHIEQVLASGVSPNPPSIHQMSLLHRVNNNVLVLFGSVMFCSLF